MMSDDTQCITVFLKTNIYLKCTVYMLISKDQPSVCLFPLYFWISKKVA